MAHVDASLVQQIFDIPKRERETDVQHHRKADDLGAGFEILERDRFGHSKKVCNRAAPLKQSSSDKTDTFSVGLSDTLRERTNRGVPMPEALAPLTSNVADLLKLHREGRLNVGMDADLVVLDENTAVRHLMAWGEWHVRDGQMARRGMYEQF